MKKPNYKDPRWQKRRLEVLEAAGFECQHCGDGSNTLHVHHTYYVPNRDVWDYPSFALECLCEDCHAGKHESDSLPLWFEDTLAFLPNNSASQDLFCDTLKELFKRGEKKGIDFVLSELFGALSRSNDHDRHMQNRKAKKAQPKTA